VNKILEGLNKAQKEAVTNFTGPSLVIAGAGSGKTRVLTHRIAYMLNNGINPSKILALTFTNKAAKEMKDRIAEIVGFETARRLWMGTFHSVFARILRYEAEALGYPSDYTIYDTIDSRSLIKTIVKELNLDDKIYKPNEILGRISGAKNNLITAEAYADNSSIRATDSSMKRPMIYEIYSRYARRCKRSGAMDFDDLLLNTNILFRNHPEILNKYMNAFDFVLVDEYQDTNYSQYLIIKKLSQEHRNICVVGDDAQSIYSFRGARIENILGFKGDYPETKTFKLERNYRSTQNIVNAANSIIQKNSGQIQKKVYSEKQAGEKVLVLEARTDNDEGFKVAGMIKDAAITEQVPYNEFAILYRTNAQSRIFEESLRKMNIPYKVYGSLSFFQRKEIKDILAYFKLVNNTSDDESLKRVINYPLRGIGKTSIAKLEEAALQNNVPIWAALTNRGFLESNFNKGTISKLLGFAKLIIEFQSKKEEMEAFDLAYTIAQGAGIIKDLVSDKTPEGISRYENIEELLNGIKEFTENEENSENNSIGDYLQTVTLYTNADLNEEDEQQEKVTVMTIHASKGLEFRQIFICGLEEELFPSHMAVSTQKELEEERRLFYVAVTRGKEKVTLSYAGSRYKWGLQTNCHPSRFIKDIDESFLELPQSFYLETPQELNSSQSFPGRGQSHRFEKNQTMKISPPSISKNMVKVEENAFNPKAEDIDPSQIMVGMEVEHPRFGQGKVINKEGVMPNVKVTVFFKTQGQKQLLLKFAKLKVIKS
jgi:DNA helicase-2/ATP-dependent DNA helicase PcrA